MDKKNLFMSFEIKGTKQDDEFFHFKGYGSTFGNEDLGGDVVVSGAFRKSLKERTPALCWQHDITDPIGVIDKVYEDEKGLWMEGRLPRESQRCKDIAALAKMGAIDGLSIGYSVRDEECKDNVRYLKEIDLYEVSFVTLPMNERARFSMKSVVPYQDLELAPTDTKWEGAAAVDRIREKTGAMEEPNSEYMKAFLWYDKENAKNFTAYKLPIADVVDGTIKAIPRAVFAAAAAIQGARGGINIPEADKEKIKNVISKYYKKLDMVAPWDQDDEKSAEIIDEIKTIKDANTFLRSKGLSSVERTLIISKIKQIANEVPCNNGPGEVEKKDECNTENLETLQLSLDEIKKTIEGLK